MIASRKLFSGLAAAIVLGALGAGCDTGFSPFTSSKEALLGKPAPAPDLSENPKLYVPPPGAPLPVPGQGTNRSWPAATDAPKTAAADATPKKEEQKGDSSGWFSGIFGSGDAKKTP
ncbi:MAG: hypothetical protein ACLPPF_22800 [Rhodomicrobium sp.]